MIGMLGGTSWPSTIEYYRILNELARDRLGGFHSANILLHSIDYHEIRSRYHDRWTEIPALLKHELDVLAGMGPDCLVICNNTLHKAYDAIEAETGFALPVFHIVKATGRAARALHMRRVLLLGTQFTMEDGFYHRGLERFGLEVVTPDNEDRMQVQKIQSRLATGHTSEDSRTALVAIIEKHAGAVDAVVLACTELPLAVRQGDCSMPVLNPTALQCAEAFDFANGAAAA